MTFPYQNIVCSIVNGELICTCFVLDNSLYLFKSISRLNRYQLWHVLGYLRTFDCIVNVMVMGILRFFQFTLQTKHIWSITLCQVRKCVVSKRYKFT